MHNTAFSSLNLSVSWRRAFSCFSLANCLLSMALRHSKLSSSPLPEDWLREGVAIFASDWIKRKIAFPQTTPMLIPRVFDGHVVARWMDAWFQPIKVLDPVVIPARRHPDRVSGRTLRWFCQSWWKRIISWPFTRSSKLTFLFVWRFIYIVPEVLFPSLMVGRYFGLSWYH